MVPVSSIYNGIHVCPCDVTYVTFDYALKLQLVTEGNSSI